VPSETSSTAPSPSPDQTVTRQPGEQLHGPYQFPEKLIPLFTLNALAGRKLPIYGDGMNVRDWLHVEDHCQGIELILTKGRIGETYNVGGGQELPNVEVIEQICRAATPPS
jgi:dTDP-glucose 4,6-dehydratase